MKFTIGYKEDYDLGGYGYIINERFSDGFSTAQGDTASVARMLAHDMIEHIDTGFDGNSDEIVALGAIYFNRDHEFCNGLGEYMPHHEIGYQLYTMYMNDITLQKCGSYSSEVAEWFDKDMYFKCLNFVRDEATCGHEYVSIGELSQMFPRQAIIRLLSKGYNKMQGLSRRYNVDMSNFFEKVRRELFNALQYHDPNYEKMSIEFDYAQKTVNVHVKSIIEDYLD